MSIHSMTNVAIARRTDYAPVDRGPQNATALADAADDPSSPQNAVATALAVIVTYIPTEILTLYVATLAAIQNPDDPTMTTHGTWIAFWFFLCLTPIVVWLVYAAKLRSNGKPLPLAYSQWPIWEMVAATLSYVAWAISLPDAPILAYFNYLPSALAAIVVLVTAAGLGLVAPIFQRPIQV